MTEPSAFRSVLAVLGSNPRAAEEAATLAQRSRARLTIIQAWRVPMVFWSQTVLASAPVSFEDALRDAEQAAALHLIRVIATLSAGPVTFSCRHGRPWIVAAREISSNRYDAVLIDRRSHRLAAAAMRHRSVACIAV
jgi:hypothetical protein